MAISAGQIVSVIPRILTGTGKDLVFNGLVFSKNKSIVSNSATSFTTADSVADYFGILSDEYKFAQVYFGGYTNSQIKPSALYFYKYAQNGCAPFLSGASVKPSEVLTRLKNITVGDFKVSINGTEIALNSLDFSSITSPSDGALILQNAIRATAQTEVVPPVEPEEDVTEEPETPKDETDTDTETNTEENTETNEKARALVSETESTAISECEVVFSSVKNNFIITTGESSNLSSITYASGLVATAMGLTVDDGAIISEGLNAQTLTEALNTCTATFQNFVTYTTLWEAEDNEALELANWATTNANNGTMYLYVCWDSAKNNLVQSFTDTISDKLKENNLGATTVCYPDYKVASFIMGTSASINWDARNGTITFAFKSQEGLTASVQETQDHNTLLQRGVNFIGNYATRNDNFVFLYNGQMFGAWQWIDAYLNSIWLCNALQVQIMAGFKLVRRVPYTEAGYALIRSWCRDVIGRALNNGVIDVGMSLSETQKTALIQDLGGDFSTEIINNGYYLQVLDATANTRQQRNSPPCNLVYTYAGSVQRLNLPAIAVV